MPSELVYPVSLKKQQQQQQSLVKIHGSVKRVTAVGWLINEKSRGVKTERYKSKCSASQLTNPNPEEKFNLFVNSLGAVRQGN